MKIITAPADYDNWSLTEHPVVFLAGGGGSFDWRKDVINKCSHLKGTILNPWREDWPKEPEGRMKQYLWEHNAIIEADVVAFWFEGPTDCPVTLYELGRTLSRNFYDMEQGEEYQAVVVGFAPGYRLAREFKERFSLTDRPFADMYGSFVDDLQTVIKGFQYLRRNP